MNNYQNYQLGIFIFFILIIVMIIIYNKDDKSENNKVFESYDTLMTDFPDLNDIADITPYIEPEFDHHYKNEFVPSKKRPVTKEEIIKYHEAANLYHNIFTSLINSKHLTSNYVIFQSPLEGDDFNNADLIQTVGYIRYNPKLFKDQYIYIGWIWNNTKFVINDYNVFKRYDQYTRYYQMPLESNEYKELIDLNHIEHELNNQMLINLKDSYYQSEEAYKILESLNNIFIHHKINKDDRARKSYISLSRDLMHDENQINPLILRYYVIIVMSDEPMYHIDYNGAVISSDDNISTIEDLKNVLKLDWKYIISKIKIKLERLVTLIIREALEPEIKEPMITTYQVFNVDIVLKNSDYFDYKDICEPYVFKINSFPDKEYMVKQDTKISMIYQDLAENLIKLLNIK